MKRERYSRQVLFSPIGERGQDAMGEKHVIIIGAGALGSSVADMLARSGVGKLTIIDRDYVEWSNLQRQQLYTEHDAENSLPKAAAAERRLKQVNSQVEIEGRVGEVTPDMLSSMEADLLIDATDNFDVRLMVNDHARMRAIPWIFGACLGSYGITHTFLPDERPCLRCIQDVIPMNGDSCETQGIISPAVTMVTSYQTTEALKILTGANGALRKTLLSFDLWENSRSEILIQRLRKKDCPTCGPNPSFPALKGVTGVKASILCGRGAVHIRPSSPLNLHFESFTERMKGVQLLSANRFLVNVSIEGHRMVVFSDGRALIHGTSDISQAEAIYRKYIDEQECVQDEESIDHSRIR
ncbi:ThiF family adenylyltransferase [Rossellomorea marisflavi]|uniref:ThiF family adenylyltransferase n=1 Tax=Rossellomorea marisflavi TaxID=189381 RepID=UPI003F9F46CB